MNSQLPKFYTSSAAYVFIYFGSFENTLYGKKDWETYCLMIEFMFQSDPFQQIYKMNHLAMQSLFKNICGKKGHSKELSKLGMPPS